MDEAAGWWTGVDKTVLDESGVGHDVLSYELTGCDNSGDCGSGMMDVFVYKNVAGIEIVASFQQTDNVDLPVVWAH